MTTLESEGDGGESDSSDSGESETKAAKVKFLCIIITYFTIRTISTILLSPIHCLNTFFFYTLSLSIHSFANILPLKFVYLDTKK